MKQFIGLIRLGALTALSIALYSAHRQTQGPQTIHNHDLKNPDHQPGPNGDLVLLGLDGTIIAREINLAPQAPLINEVANPFLDLAPTDPRRSS